MFEERFARIMQALNVSKDAELAKKLGITQPSVASAKKRLQIPTGWIEKTSILAKVSTDWLFFGRGPMRSDDPTGQQPPATRPAVPPASESALQAACPRCARLEAKLEKLESKLESVEAQRDELAQENRQLWKENGEYRERLPVMKSAPLNRTWKNLIRVIALLLERKK